MTETNKLTLKFDTSKGEVFSLPIQNAMPGVNQATVTQAMQDIITSNVFSSVAGNLTGINSAELTTVETIEIGIAL